MSKKLTIEYIRNKLNDIGYTLISTEYISATHKMDIKCDKGHIYSQTWGNFYTGHRCPKCNILNKRNSIEDIKKYIESFGYTLLSNSYKNRDEKLSVVCPKGHLFEITYGNFLNGRRCSECYICKKKSEEEVKNLLNKFNYKLLSEYKSANSKITVECNFGHNYETTYAKFSVGKRCPKCNISTGHNRICTYLDKHSIEYEIEYRLKDCNNYRFDVFIPNLNMAIEYDGQQHFEPVDCFGGEEGFRKNLQRDLIKNKYCKDNNIYLLRISYKEYNNIENILDNKIQINDKTSTTKNP